MTLDAHIPSGPLAQKWDKHKFELKLINPANKRKFDVIVVGSGLAGASAAATLAELGYSVKCFCFQDSPRRAHSIAAQGGINAAKNYKNDGDSIYRLFYDTIKGGDFLAREANVYRRARPGERRNCFAPLRRRGARHRRLRQRLLSLDERQRLQRHRHLARLQKGRGVRQSVLHADSPDLHPRQRRPSIEIDAHVRIAAQRRPRLGAETKGGWLKVVEPDSRGGPRLFPRTQVSQLWQ